MAKIKTFADSGLLISAWKYKKGDITSQGLKALLALGDKNRVFASSYFVRLEVFPKAHTHGTHQEINFYNRFFQAVKYWSEPNLALLKQAIKLRIAYQLGALDSLLVASALRLKANEFLTTEKPNKPMFRVKGLKVTSIA